MCHAFARFISKIDASILEAAGHGDLEVAKHAVQMKWPPCPSVMSAACIGRHFELLKLFRKAWAGCPGSAIGFHCTDDVLMHKDGEMLSFLIKHDMLCEESIDMIGESLTKSWK